MRILITGGEGQLGAALQRALSAHDVDALGRASLDVTDAGCIGTWLRDTRPDCVIHCAALTDTSRCERDPALADRINAGGARNVAEQCAQVDVRLIAISTNEVFDGQQQTAYDETASPAPVNAYGRSKLAGERAAMAVHRDTLVVRTSWLYGDGDGNFVARVLAAARDRRPLRFVTDEIASPTSCDDLAAATGALLGRKAPPGIYHLAGEGEASRYDWAREILRLAGLADASLEPVTTADLRAHGYDGPNKPPYSVLRNTRAAAIGVVMAPWREAIAAHFGRAPVRADA